MRKKAGNEPIVFSIMDRIHMHNHMLSTKMPNVFYLIYNQRETNHIYRSERLEQVEL